MGSIMSRFIPKSFAVVAVVIMVSFLASCEPEKQEIIHVQSISLNHNTLSILLGGTADLVATVKPSNATDASVSWSSSDQSVATVSEGTVTAVGAGSAIITATADGKSDTCIVTVETVESEEAVLVVGEVAKIPAEGATVDVDVQYNVTFSVTVDPSAESWIHYVETKAVQSGKIVFVVDLNEQEERSGIVTISDNSGKVSPISITLVQEGSGKIPEEAVKATLMKFYDALDGPNWKITRKWDPSVPLNDWQGVVILHGEDADELDIDFHDFGLKGELPDCFDELSDLTHLSISDEPGLTGTLPPSFSKLKNLQYLTVLGTSMTGLPDLFDGIPLKRVLIASNRSMTGPLPESLGSSSDLSYLGISGNAFTGRVPDSWARLGTKLDLLELYLDEHVPDSFVTCEYAGYLINMYLVATQKRETPLAVGDYDIPAYWPERDIMDIVTGKAIPYAEIVSGNKVTVLLNWATWCPYSKTLVPLLKKMYDKYHGDGLEIIAAYNADSPEVDMGRPLKDILLERNYDGWYNFNLWNFSATEWSIWCSGGTPSAILVDSKGNIIASSRERVNDPTRGRFGYTASTNLIPLLEEIFGPMEEEDDYFSTDFSRDGEVMTIQTATVGKGINIVFMGDAYTDRDMDEGGLYEQMMYSSAEEFFSIEPYKTFRNRFNVYAVKAVSKDGKTGKGNSTALGSEATHNSITTGNMDKCFEYALKVPGIQDDRNLLIGVLVNSVSERGITFMSESRQSGIAFYGSRLNEPNAFGPTLRHEAGGHGFAFLDDEYVTMQGKASQEHIAHRNEMYRQYGWYSNVDFTDDPSKVKWRFFLTDERYKEDVGIFEGGSLYQKGAYRPSENSMMREKFEYFNAPSRWAIYKRIMELSGEEASFDKFLEYDKVNRSKEQNAVSRPHLRTAENSPVNNFAPPVVVP